MNQHRMCPHCRALISPTDRTCSGCGEKVGPRAIDLRRPDDILGGMLPADRFVTMLLLMANTAIFVVTVVMSMRAGNLGGLLAIDRITLIEFGANYPTYVAVGQWWRVLTAGYLHVDLMHIGMNMMGLLFVGERVEREFGSGRMAVIWTISTMTGFWTSYYFAKSFSAGASAGLFGLMGAMIGFGTLHRHNAIAAEDKRIFIQMAVYSVLVGFILNIPADNWAHFGGLAGGYAVAMLAGEEKRDGGGRDRLWNWLGIAALALTVLAFARQVAFSFLH